MARDASRERKDELPHLPVKVEEGIAGRVRRGVQLALLVLAGRQGVWCRVPSARRGRAGLHLWGPDGEAHVPAVII